MFRAARPIKGAAQLGDRGAHLASVERQLGRRVVVEDEPDVELPDVLAHLWDWFEELAGRRTGGPAGPNPLTFPDVLAWAQMTGRDPTPEEVLLLFRLDDTMLSTLRGAADGS